MRIDACMAYVLSSLLFNLSRKSKSRKANPQRCQARDERKLWLSREQSWAGSEEWSWSPEAFVLGDPAVGSEVDFQNRIGECWKCFYTFHGLNRLCHVQEPLNWVFICLGISAPCRLIDQPRVTAEVNYLPLFGYSIDTAFFPLIGAWDCKSQAWGWKNSN